MAVDLFRAYLCLMSSSIFRSMFARGGGGRMWRSIGGRMLMSTISSPWLMLPPGRDRTSGHMIHNFYSIGDKKKHSFDGRFALEEGTRFVGSSHGWLALFNDRNNHLFLTNPLSGHRLDLPAVDRLYDPQIDLTDGNVSVSKVVLSCSPDVGDWRAVIAYAPERRLALYYSTGLSGWTRIGISKYAYRDFHGKVKYEYPDFVYCRRGRSFICSLSLEDVDSRDTIDHCIEYWFVGDANEDPVNVTISRPSLFKEITKELNANSGEIGFSSHLVFIEQMNQLLFLVRFVSDNKTVRFLVFRLDNEHGLVNKVRLVRPDQSDSLEGLAIFVGINHSFALTAADFPNIKPDSIYFASPDSGNVEIFDFESQTVSPCYHPSQADSIKPNSIFYFESQTVSPCYHPSRADSIVAAAPLWFLPDS